MYINIYNYIYNIIYIEREGDQHENAPKSLLPPVTHHERWSWLMICTSARDLYHGDCCFIPPGTSSTSQLQRHRRPQKPIWTLELWPYPLISGDYSITTIQSKVFFVDQVLAAAVSKGNPKNAEDMLWVLHIRSAFFTERSQSLLRLNL